MAINFGIFAGTLAKYFDAENERITASTDKVLDSLANLVIRENDARQKKVDLAKESISRLEALGFNRAKAASIARGGLYAVNDAANAATKAKNLGQDVNTYYAATSEFKPEDYAEYTVAELAQSIVPTLNIDKSAEALTKGRQINTERVNDAVAKYRGSQITPTDITLPTFAQNPEKFGGGKFTITELTSSSNYLKKKIQEAAVAAGVSNSGYSVSEIDGRSVGVTQDEATYAKWLTENLPSILEREKENVDPRSGRLLDAAAAGYLKQEAPSITIGEDGNIISSLKATPKGGDKARDPAKVKNVIVVGIVSGDSYETLKAEAIEDGVPGDLFDQLYEEVTKQPGTGRNAPRGRSNEAPVVEQPVQAASQQSIGQSRRASRTGN